jgi:hypothetical protein
LKVEGWLGRNEVTVVERIRYQGSKWRQLEATGGFLTPWSLEALEPFFGGIQSGVDFEPIGLQLITVACARRAFSTRGSGSL